MTEDELNATGEWLWVPDKTEVFVSAKLLASRGNKHRVEYEDGDWEEIDEEEMREVRVASQ